MPAIFAQKATRGGERLPYAASLTSLCGKRLAVKPKHVSCEARVSFSQPFLSALSKVRPSPSCHKPGSSGSSKPGERGGRVYGQMLFSCFAFLLLPKSNPMGSPSSRAVGSVHLPVAFMATQQTRRK